MPPRMVDMGPAQPTTSRPRRETTIHDVAREANVSKTTASRVLNGSPNVAPETRARVLDAVRQIDYRVNVTARSLRTTAPPSSACSCPRSSTTSSAGSPRARAGAPPRRRRPRDRQLGLEHGRRARRARVAPPRRVDALVLSLVDDCDPEIASCSRRSRARSCCSTARSPASRRRRPHRSAQRHHAGARAPARARPSRGRHRDDTAWFGPAASAVPRSEAFAGRLGLRR